MLNNNVPELVDDLADLAVVRLGRGPCPPSQTPDQVRFTEAYEQASGTPWRGCSSAAPMWE
jgi:hypothetical protein